MITLNFVFVARELNANNVGYFSLNDMMFPVKVQITMRNTYPEIRVYLYDIRCDWAGSQRNDPKCCNHNSKPDPEYRNLIVIQTYLNLKLYDTVLVNINKICLHNRRCEIIFTICFNTIHTHSFVVINEL